MGAGSLMPVVEGNIRKPPNKRIVGTTFPWLDPLRRLIDAITGPGKTVAGQIKAKSRK